MGFGAYSITSVSVFISLSVPFCISGVLFTSLFHFFHPTVSRGLRSEASLTKPGFLCGYWFDSFENLRNSKSLSRRLSIFFVNSSFQFLYGCFFFFIKWACGAQSRPIMRMEDV